MSHCNSHSLLLEFCNRGNNYSTSIHVIKYLCFGELECLFLVTVQATHAITVPILLVIQEVQSLLLVLLEYMYSMADSLACDRQASCTTYVQLHSVSTVQGGTIICHCTVDYWINRRVSTFRHCPCITCTFHLKYSVVYFITLHRKS